MIGDKTKTHTKGKVFSRINSIKYFEEKCINRFEKLENEFMNNSTMLAEYVYGFTVELHKLGLEMIKESLESTNRCSKRVQSGKRTGIYIFIDTNSSPRFLEMSNLTKCYSVKNNWEVCILLDRIIEMAPNERMAHDD